MTSFEIALIVHVLAVFVLSAVLGIELVSLAQMRGAVSSAEAYPWLYPLRKLPLLAGPAILIILFSGARLVHEEGAMSQSWPKIAAASLLLMAPLGAVTGRKMKIMRKACTESRPELMQLLRDPFLKISLGVRISMFLGIFLLVTVKPKGLVESLGVIGSCAVTGAGASLLGRRSNVALSASGTEAGD